MKVEFNKAQIKAAIDAASTDPAWSSCQMVRIEWNRMVSTDGRRIYIVPIEPIEPTEDAHTDALHIVREEAIRIAKMMERNSRATIERDDDGTIRLTIDGRACGDVALLTYEPNFPEYSRELPSGDPVLSIGISPHYLRDLCDAAISLSIKRGAMIQFDFFGPENAFKAVCGPDPNGGECAMTAVIMPMRL